MIDNTLWVVKVVLALISAWLIFASSKGGKTKLFSSGVTLFLLILFMTGAEMITDSETPWNYLLLSGTKEDWLDAFFGGAMMLMLPVVWIAIGSKCFTKTSGQGL